MMYLMTDLMFSRKLKGGEGQWKLMDIYKRTTI